MPRKQYKYHFIYKTLNLINDKYYIGMHSTAKLDDGYLGSGKRLRRSVRRYGKENFRLEILEFLDSRESLANRERELVNEDVLKDPMCMNLKTGGNGGCSEEVKKIWQSAGKDGLQKRLREDIEFKARMIEISRNEMLRRHKEGLVNYNTFEGRFHKPETIEKMKQSKKGYGVGESNSQFGTIWITNGVEDQKIKKDSKIPENWYKGRK